MISIITATYNRSNVLAYAITSVLRSTYEDWELIVVGDACTDDTESVVTSFGDPRIRFYNLEENFGDQSGPNNVGFSLARGEYVAYLNHDDLYFPDHLEAGLGLIESADADFVHSAALRCLPDGDDSTRLTLHAVSDSHQYNPISSIPASTWLVHRKLIEEIGPWKPATQCYGPSSQDWLFRAWVRNSKMLFTRRATVLIIPSGIRTNDYANREVRDTQHYFEAMAATDFRERSLEDVAIRAAAQRITARLSPLYHVKIFGSYCYRLLARLLMHFGVGPRDLLYMFMFGRKGNFIGRLRRRRGLAPLDAHKQKTAVLRIDNSAQITRAQKKES